MPRHPTSSGSQERGIQILSTDLEGVVVVAIRESIFTSEPVCDEFEYRLGKLVRTIPQAKVVVDLYHVTAISSKALAGLLDVHRMLKDGGGNVTLARVQPSVREVLAVTRLDEAFRVHENLDDAINGF